MSAIGGVWRFDGAPAAADACPRILSAQAIYGPHASDQWDGHDIVLGRRLFRLLPEDRYDTQPLTGVTGAVLVADVRLDNRGELQAALGVDEGRAGVTCDAALLLAAWERWGEACFDHIVGVYAFAVWEPSKRRLILARDLLGARPLYYRRTAQSLAFASMPAGLHAIAETPPAPDIEHLAVFLALVPDAGASSFYKDVERVEPGAMLIVDPTAVRTQTHWPPPHRNLGVARSEDYVDGLRERLDRAVESQLRGAGDAVGTHLSSGWDSAAVTATAARLMAARSGRVVSFTAVPPPGAVITTHKGRHGDEGPLAAIQAARHGNIDHIRVASEGRSPLDDLDADTALIGGPIRNTCNQVWANDINRTARSRGIRVLLDGEYGNVSLTYDGEDGLLDLVSNGQWASWFRFARILTGSGARRWRGVLAASFEPYGPPALWAALRRLNDDQAGPPGAHSALKRRLWRTIGQRRRRRDKTSFDRRLGNLRRADLGTYHKAVLARWRIDVRQPLADRRLIEFSLSIPGKAFAAGGAPRSLARRALADRVAPEILDSPTHGYQGVDWHVGLTAARAELNDELERLAGCPPVADLLDLPRLRRLLRDWPTEGWDRQLAITNYRMALQRGLTAARFARRMLGGNT